jgi:predicted TIM-barrel fold metal-dependent hydrolase
VRGRPRTSWAPWLLHRLDEHHEWTGWYEATDLTMAPSDYFRRNCYLSVEADEATAVHYVDWFGADNLVFSTDYPHGDSAYPHAVHGFEELAIAFDAKVRIVGDNWSRLYNIPLTSTPRPASPPPARRQPAGGRAHEPDHRRRQLVVVS